MHLLLTGETRLAFLAHGIPASCYIDDSGSVGASEAECQDRQDGTVAVATKLGWPINEKKRHEDRPSQSTIFRGILFDTVSGHMRIPPARVRRTVTLIEDILAQGKVQCRKWRRLMGFLEWHAQVTPDGRPRVTPLWSPVALFMCNSWMVSLSADARHHLLWWRDFLSATLSGSLHGRIEM